MATILKFRSGAPGDDRGVILPHADGEATARSMAQIIIFPGVRIERYEDEPVEAGEMPSARRAAKRTSKRDSRRT